MKIVERTALLLSLTGILLKIFDVRRSNDLIVIGVTLLALIYFYMSFALFNKIPFRAVFKKVSYSSVGLGRLLGAVGLGVGLSIAVIGILFKLLTLPGANEMLIIGCMCLFVVLFAAVVIFFVKRNNMDFYYKNVFIRGVAILLIGITLLSLPRYSLIRFFHRNDPVYRDLIIKANENPQDGELWQELEKMQKERNK